jgi:hypothetical protein
MRVVQPYLSLLSKHRKLLSPKRNTSGVPCNAVPHHKRHLQQAPTCSSGNGQQHSQILGDNLWSHCCCTRWSPQPSSQWSAHKDDECASCSEQRFKSQTYSNGTTRLQPLNVRTSTWCHANKTCAHP